MKDQLWISIKMQTIWKDFCTYLGMIKFSHTFFALPIAGVAALQALSFSDEKATSNDNVLLLLVAIVVCMISLRSAAMGFNRIVDSTYDAENPRTKNRAIPKGAIAIKRTMLFVVLFSFIFLISAATISFTIHLLAYLVLFLALLYSYTKRFSFLCHFYLGFVIGLAPNAVWLVIQGELHYLAILWTIAMTFYIAGFDILYSLQDYEYDKKKNLHSLAVKMGQKNALWISCMCHVIAYLCFICIFLLVPEDFKQKIFFGLSVVLVGLFFFLEHFLIHLELKRWLSFAFFQINVSISSILFLGILLDFFILL